MQLLSDLLESGIEREGYVYKYKYLVEHCPHSDEALTVCTKSGKPILTCTKGYDSNRANSVKIVNKSKYIKFSNVPLSLTNLM